jgi:clan AA aspartic protease
MIRGEVNASLEAVVRVLVRGQDGQERSISAIIDTGFSGMLTLPYEIITALQLPFLARDRGLLADGSEVLLERYVAEAEWNERPRRISVIAVDAQPLIGMRLLAGSTLTIEVVEGGSILIAPRSR